MADDDNIRNKIRALLARAAPGSGASENEQASAMNLAAMLMTRHGIQMSIEEAQEDPTGYGDLLPGEYGKWERECGNAAAYLYSCRMVYYGRGKDTQVRFVGRPDNVDAAGVTFLWLVKQVEELYKQALPRGLSKAVRAELRRTFKFACATRIRARAWRLVQTLANDDAVALPSTGSTALVVKSHQEKLFGEADAFLKSQNTRIAKVKSSKAGIGTQLGFMAGDTVQLQKAVAEKRLKLEHRK
jgi:hypothetical protein